MFLEKKEGKSAGLSERSSSTPLGIASHKGYQPYALITGLLGLSGKGCRKRGS